MQSHVWNSLAEIDPLWAILSDPEKRHRGWKQDEFFATGEREIVKVLELAVRLRLPTRRETALDFGCGVGRLTRALSQHFERVVGVDASSRMVELAREMNAHIGNCEFVTNETRLPVLNESTDFIYSVLVLQHLDSEREIALWLREFVRVLRPGGLLVFQIPHRYSWMHRLQLRRRVYAVLSGMGVSEARLHHMGLSPIRMTGMKPVTVRDHLDIYKATLLSELTDWHGPHSSIYFVTK